MWRDRRRDMHRQVTVPTAQPTVSLGRSTILYTPSHARQVTLRHPWGYMSARLKLSTSYVMFSCPINRDRRASLDHYPMNNKAFQSVSYKTIYNCCSQTSYDEVHGPNSSLTSMEAGNHLKIDGPNMLPQAYDPSWWRDLLWCFTFFFSLFTQVAALLCTISYLYDNNDILHLYLSIFLFIAVTATSLFFSVQYRLLNPTLRKFQNFLLLCVLVIRDGEAQVFVDAIQLVVGNIVIIDAGDWVPSDVNAIESNHFAVDIAFLTFEGTPAAWTTAAVHDAVLDAFDLALFGCFAIDESWRGVVVAVGDSTKYDV